MDLVAANATFSYYLKGVVGERLAADMISPAQARGFAQTVRGMRSPRTG